jgi:uncharacterized protein YkwD
MSPRRASLALAATLAFCISALSPVTERVGAQAKGASSDASSLEAELLNEINLARTKPIEYAGIIEKTRSYFKGNTYQPPGQQALATQEGAKALEEAVAFLRRAQPLRPFSLSSGMTQGARTLVLDQGSQGLTGHKGSDGSFCEQRLGRFGKLQGAVGENLSYSRESARERVIAWLLDDGFATRGHRQALMHPGYKVVGVSCGEHARQGVMCVVTFADGFSETDGQRGGVRSF